MSAKHTFTHRIFLAAALAVLLAGTLVPASAAARPAGEEYIPNPDAEAYFIDELINYGYVDLAEFSDDPADRVISGRTFADAIRDPSLKDHGEVWIMNVTISDFVYLSAVTLEYDIWAWDLHFADMLQIDNAEVGTFYIDGAIFDGNVNMSDLHSSGSISILNATFHDRLYLNGANVDGTLSLEESVFEGEVYLPGANIRRLMINGASLEGVSNFEGSNIRSIICQNSNFGEWANFGRVVVELDADFSGSSFSDVDFDLFTAGRSVDFSDVHFSGYANFAEASMGRASFVDAQFDGLLWLSETRIDGNLDMSGVVITFTEQPADLSHMRIGESILLGNIQAPGGLSIDRTRATELFIMGNQDHPQMASLSLWLTQTTDQFVLFDVQLGSLDATGASFQGTTNISNVSITDEFNLRNTHFQLMVIDSLAWPQDPTAFDMRGMTYTDIDLGEGELTDQTWKQLLYIVEESTYSPQAYRALAVFLTEKGHPDWANQVSLAMKRRERSEALDLFSAAWFWSWFLEIFAGYGYNPGLAFLWSGLVVGAGAFVFRRKEDMLPVDQDEVKLHYHPLLYSFALFLPYIDLGIAGKWEPDPEKKFPAAYKHIHRLLGWVLMPVALLAFSGILG